jgi:hypothetical protein
MGIHLTPEPVMLQSTSDGRHDGDTVTFLANPQALADATFSASQLRGFLLASRKGQNRPRRTQEGQGAVL